MIAAHRIRVWPPWYVSPQVVALRRDVFERDGVIVETDDAHDAWTIVLDDPPSGTLWVRAGPPGHVADLRIAKLGLPLQDLADDLDYSDQAKRPYAESGGWLATKRSDGVHLIFLGLAVLRELNAEMLSVIITARRGADCVIEKLGFTPIGTVTDAHYGAVTAFRYNIWTRGRWERQIEAYRPIVQRLM